MNLRTIIFGARAARSVIVAVIFGVIGLAMLAGGAYARYTTAAEIRTFLPADGVVVGNIASRSGRNNSTTYAAQVRFTAQDGSTVTFKEGFSANPPAHQVGDKVKVLYEPGNPQNARVDDFMNGWFLPLLLGGMGLIFGLVGVSLGLNAIRAGVAAARAAATGF
jgi:hypothetical protein